MTVLYDPSVGFSPSAPVVGTSGTFSGQLIGNGTTTNDNAAAGRIGEFVFSEVLIGSAVALTTNVATNVTSISLTAGDWDVSGNIAFNPNVATTVSLVGGWISNVSATAPTAPNLGAEMLSNLSFTTGQVQLFQLGPIRFSLSGTTTIYLTSFNTFAVNVASAYGYIRARRVR